MKKLWIALLAMMLLIMMSAGAMAAAYTLGNLTVSTQDGACTISNWILITQPGTYTLTSNGTASTGVVVNRPQGDVTLILDGVQIDATQNNRQTHALSIYNENYKTTILLRGSNSLTSWDMIAGLTVVKDSKVEIRCADHDLTEHTCGSLTAVGGEYGAGIGGVMGSDTGGIEMISGTIVADGGKYAAGIGGGGDNSGVNGGDAKDIVISGGHVKAEGDIGRYSNTGGIGAGHGGRATGIVINGSDRMSIAVRVSETGFDSMTEIAGSPFTTREDVTELVRNYPYFEAIGTPKQEEPPTQEPEGNKPDDQTHGTGDTQAAIDAASLPKTGDSSSLALWCALLAMAGGFLWMMRRRRYS